MGWLADRRADRERLKTIGLQASYVSEIYRDVKSMHADMDGLKADYSALRKVLVPDAAAQRQAALDAWRAETNIDGLIAQRDSLLARIEVELDSASVHRFAEALSHTIGLIQVANQSKPR